MVKSNIKKIGLFLKSLEGADFLYLHHCAGMRLHIQELIKNHQLSKEQFCKLMDITPREYTDFVKGNRNYDVHDMAMLNAAFMELEMVKLKDKVPVKIAPPDKSK